MKNSHNIPLILISPDLKKEVKANELRNQRLKEVFAKKIQEFREACYRLTGYQINNPADNQYNLMSMYAESSTDALLFQVGMHALQCLTSNKMAPIFILSTGWSIKKETHFWWPF